MSDINFNAEVFRKDHPMILAKRRDLADIGSVRLEYHADGYVAGEVLGRRSAGPKEGLYGKYDDSGTSGLDTARCILFTDVPVEAFKDSSDSRLERGIFSGYVYEDKLTGLTSDAKTDLGGKTQVEADGVNVMKF